MHDSVPFWILIQTVFPFFTFEEISASFRASKNFLLVSSSSEPERLENHMHLINSVTYYVNCWTNLTNRILKNVSNFDKEQEAGMVNCIWNEKETI